MTNTTNDAKHILPTKGIGLPYARMNADGTVTCPVCGAICKKGNRSPKSYAQHFLKASTKESETHADAPVLRESEIPESLTMLMDALGITATKEGINFVETTEFFVMITRDHVAGNDEGYYVDSPAGTVFKCHGISWDSTTTFASHADEEGRTFALPIISAHRACNVEFV